MGKVVVPVLSCGLFVAAGIYIGNGQWGVAWKLFVLVPLLCIFSALLSVLVVVLKAKR